jgi:hypothetical protein
MATDDTTLSAVMISMLYGTAVYGEWAQFKDV